MSIIINTYNYSIPIIDITPKTNAGMTFIYTNIVKYSLPFNL